MNWKRERPGVYVAGPYRVERQVTRWAVTGPGVAQSRDHKAEAQAECERVMAIRVADPDANAPVVGDIVETIADKRRGQVSAIMPPRGQQNDLTCQPLWCIKFTRGKRLCLFRHEITVVTP